MRKGLFILLILLSTLSFSRPRQSSATALQILADSLAPGEWGQMDVSSGVAGVAKPTDQDTVLATQPNPGGMYAGVPGGAAGYIFGQAAKMEWDSVAQQFYYIGGDHDQCDGGQDLAAPCNGLTYTRAKFVHYDAVTNSWGQYSDPSWKVSGVETFLNGTMHEYYSLALDPVARRLYSWPGPNRTIYFFRQDTNSPQPGTWSYHPPSLSYNTSTRPMCWSPERQAVILTAYVSDGGVDNQLGQLAEYREGDSSWRGLSLAVYKMGQQQHFCEYDPVHHGMRFGGGVGTSWTTLNGGRQQYYVTFEPAGIDPQVSPDGYVSPNIPPGDVWGVQNLDQAPWGGLSVLGGLGVDMAITVTDPLTGDMIVADRDGNFRSHHIEVNSSGVITNSGSQWTDLTSSLPAAVSSTSTGIFTPFETSCGEVCGTVAGAVRDYGVVVFVTCSHTPSCRMWVYKYANVPVIPDPQPFAVRSAGVGVLRSFDFTSDADLQGLGSAAPGALGLNYGVLPIDLNTTIYPMSRSTASECASTADSSDTALKFTLNPNLMGATGGDISDIGGTWFANFTSDLSYGVDTYQDVYVQLRACWDSPSGVDYGTYIYPSNHGKKLFWIGAGDENAANVSARALTGFVDYPTVLMDGTGVSKTCTWGDLVVQDTDNFGVYYPYQSCYPAPSIPPFHVGYTGVTGATPFGPPYTTFQDALPSPYCYSADSMTLAMSNNCVTMASGAGAWNTFQLHLHLGPYHTTYPGDCCGWRDSTVQLWITPQGGKATLVTNNTNWAYNRNDNATALERIGKLIITPYITGAMECTSGPPTCPVFHVWYKSVIISKDVIPDAAETVVSCTPDHLAFTSQPSNALLGASLGPVTVHVKDSGGNDCGSDTSTVALSKHAGTCTGMTLNGTVSGAASSGVFTTSNLSMTVATGSCSLDAADGMLTGATSNAFTISSPPVGIGMGKKR